MAQNKLAATWIGFGASSRILGGNLPKGSSEGACATAYCYTANYVFCIFIVKYLLHIHVYIYVHIHMRDINTSNKCKCEKKNHIVSHITHGVVAVKLHALNALKCMITVIMVIRRTSHLWRLTKGGLYLSIICLSFIYQSFALKTISSRSEFWVWYL